MLSSWPKRWLRLLLVPMLVLVVDVAFIPFGWQTRGGLLGSAFLTVVVELPFLLLADILLIKPYLRRTLETSKIPGEEVRPESPADESAPRVNESGV
jgi:hypothetical protein